MGEHFRGKLNWLHVHVPEGFLIDARWLARHGYSGSLRSKYVSNGWLQQVAHSVYRRPAATVETRQDESIGWQEVVVSLQTLLEQQVTVGGRSALELQGFAHYLANSGPREIHLYGTKPPPRWLSRLRIKTRFAFHNSAALFDESSRTELSGSEDSDATRGLVRQPWGQRDWPIVMSSPERAILELLDEVPQKETFHQADVLIDGLPNLRPRSLHALLVRCRSVKVKRLFFWFAERHEHAWLKGLSREGVDLGRGKRMLVRGGRLDPKYEITVPENLDAVH